MTHWIEIPTLTDQEETLPKYASDGAAGADVRARLDEPVTLSPGNSCLIPTGLKFAIPEGYEVQVRPRSGLALKNQITVLNTPGTIDSDYRGEIGVILINHGKKDFVIENGDRIAQLVVDKVVQGHFILHEDLLATERGEGGFGHTGVN